MGTHPIFESDFDCLTETRMEVLKRRPVATDESLNDPKRPKVATKPELAATLVENNDSDSSEDEAELLERLFGANQPQAPTVADDAVLIDNEKEEEEKPVIEIDERKDDDECVWQDEDDDQDAQKNAQTRFAELSSGWLNVKKVVQDEDGDIFAGRVLVDDATQLPEKELDIEACGLLGWRNRPVADFRLHHAAPVAAVAQMDSVVLYQVDGRRNALLQSIRLDKFQIKSAQIISDAEILCTSNVPWFFTYDIVHGSIIRHNHISGYKKGQQITGRYHTSVESPYLAFPTLHGGINIVSKKNKDHVDTVQSGTNSCVDCHFSKDGNRVWSLAENGEIMCFDLRQMRAVQCFNQNDEMALFASSLVSGQTKLFHAKSNSMFGNFPGERKLGAVEHAQFSPNSGFLGVGDGKVVKLFKLNHYTSY